MKVLFAKSELKTELGEFLKLAMPLAGAQIAQAMTGFVDTVMMGWLGQLELAAGGLAVMVFTLFLMTGTGLLASVSPLVAEAYGAERFRRVGQVMRQGLWLALLIAIPSVPVIAHLGELMALLGQDPAVIELSDTYLDVMRWGLLPGLTFFVLRGTVTALSRARPILVIMVGANVLNMVGNYVLAFGKLGLPALGLAGLALSSVLAHGLMFLALLGYILWHQRSALQSYRLFDRLHQIELPVMRSLLRVGLPISISTILEHGLFVVMTLMMGALGAHVLAAQQLALQTVVIVFMLPLAMSYAATIRVGQWYGQRNWDGVRRAAIVSVSSAIALMLIAGTIFVAFPEALISLYLDVNEPTNRDVIAVGTTLLTVAGFGQIVDGVQKTANGVLQGLQDTRIPMLIGLFAYWGVGLASGYWLGFHTPLAGVGIWIGAYVGLTVTAIAYIWRFRWVLANKEEVDE